MSDLQKLDNIGKRGGDIKAFVLSSNFIEARTGKDGWGFVKIAIDNASVPRMFNDELSKEEWEKERESNKT